MELRQLKYFVAVADTLNFSRAADTLYVSQSALSKQISDLESELDARLFRRNNRNVALTDSGVRLLSEARAILAQAGMLYDVLHAAPSEHQIRIGIQERAENTPLLHHALAEELYSQTQMHPGLRPQFFRRDTAGAILSVLNKELDLGIILDDGRGQDPELESQTLMRDEFVVVSRSEPTPEDAPASVRRLLSPEAELVLIRNEMYGLVRILSILEALDCHPQIRFADSLAAMLLNVESGSGVTIIPRSIYRQFVSKNTKACHMDTDIAKIRIMAIWRKDGNALVKEVVENTVKRIRASEGEAMPAAPAASLHPDGIASPNR